MKTLGEGAFGKSFLARYHGAFVCVKAVQVESQQDQVSFFREIEALSCLRHPNILPFVGACFQKPDHCWLICEYMAGGTLAKWLHGDQGRSQPLIARLQKALELAQGMEACQKCKPSIVHRDLKPSNIFLDEGRNARIGDFGLARRMNPEGISSLTGETGTYIYMSPEMIKHEVYDSATDVWSWGVIACELISKSLPYYGHYLTPIHVAMGVSEGKLQPSFPKDIHPRLNALLESVVSFDPMERPSFEMIVKELSDILTELRETAQPAGIVQRLLRLQG